MNPRTKADIARPDGWYYDNVFGLDPLEAVAMIESLSPRQRMVANRLAMGMSSAEIIAELGYPARTHENNHRIVCRKLKTTVHGIARVWFCAVLEGELS